MNYSVHVCLKSIVIILKYKLCFSVYMINFYEIAMSADVATTY